MALKEFVDNILVLQTAEELAGSLVAHFNVRFRPRKDIVSDIHGVRLEEILVEVFKRLGLK